MTPSQRVFTAMKNLESFHRWVPSRQRGVTTLAITLLLLVILTVIVLFSTNLAFFEQRTAGNDIRARLVEQAAEYGVNLAGEYIKANRSRIIDNTAANGGWLAPGSPRWVRCSTVAGFPDIADFADGTRHPCMAERDPTRRGQLWFYTTDGSGSTSATIQLPYGGVTGTVGNVGGAAAFPATVAVHALLCRIDSTLATPACAANPTAGNRVAVTLISNASLTGEASQATVKETWASYSDFSPTSSVPLVGSGFIQGLGNAQIVAAPNGGGYGVPVSIWSPNDVDIESSSGGSVGSVSTCHVGEYLKGTPESELKTTCATVNNACGCPAVSATGDDYLSGHAGAIKKESIDIVDRDGGLGTLPDHNFFPGRSSAGVELDDPADPTDDSLFEWIFNVDYVVSEGGSTVNTDCGDGGDQNCAVYALVEQFGAESITCAELTALGADASGLYYVDDYASTGACGLPDQVGSPDSPAIVVLEQEVTVGKNTLFYGMLFVRSDDNTAEMTGNGNPKIFGSIVVEGDIKLTGNLDLVYDDTSVGSDPNKLPPTAKFGRVPGSWLDDSSGF